MLCFIVFFQEFDHFFLLIFNNRDKALLPYDNIITYKSVVFYFHSYKVIAFLASFDWHVYKNGVNISDNFTVMSV